MSTLPRLSVALCTYNGARYLWQQLESIVAQDRLPDEVVACDDRSSDDTVDLLHSFARTAPFPVHVHVNDETLGSTKNFEKAVRLCSGEIIALSDQDDVWLPGKLRALEKLLASNPRAGAVFSDAEMVDDGLRPLNLRLWESIRFGPAQRRMLRDGRAIDVLLRHNVVTGATMAFRSALRDLVLPFPREWVHDGWIALLVATRADLDFVEQPLIKYRQHANQQLGAPKKSLLVRTRRAAADRARYTEQSVNAYRAEVARVTIATERLAELRSAPWVLRRLEAKRQHLIARAQLSKSRLERVPVVWREIRFGNYRKYSNSWSSVLRDLFV